MATQRWTGGSLNRKKTDTLLISGAGATNDTITLTIDNVDFIITVGGTTTTAGIATTVQQAYSGSTLTPDTTATCTIPVADGGALLIPQFSEYTATVAGSTVTFTSNGTGALAGKPITMSGAKSGTVTITYTSNVIAPTSQYHADQADNFSGNAVLGASDTFILDNGSTDIRWGLSTGVTLTLLTKYKSYSGNVGLPEVNIDNSSKPYHEYRTTYFTTTGCTTANLEVGDGTGSGRFKLDTGSGQSAINIFGRGSRIESGVPCILWKGTHASNTIGNLAGDFAAAFFGGEVATILTLVTGDGPNSSASTFCGSGCTLTTVRVNGGTQITYSAVTTATQYGGQWDHFSGTITTLTVHDGATFTPHAACTITTGTVYGKIDLSKTSGTITFTNLVTLDGNGWIYDPNGKATFSAGYKLNSATAKVTRPIGDTHTLS